MADPQLTKQQREDALELHKLLEAQPKLLRGISGIWDSIKTSIIDSKDENKKLAKESKNFLGISKSVLENTEDIHKANVSWQDITEKINKATRSGNTLLSDRYKQMLKLQNYQKRYNNVVNAGANSIQKMVSGLDSGIRNIPFIGDFLADAINFDDVGKNLIGGFRESFAVGGPAGKAISGGLKDNVMQGMVEGATSGAVEAGRPFKKLWGMIFGQTSNITKDAFVPDPTKDWKDMSRYEKDLQVILGHNDTAKSYRQSADRLGLKEYDRTKNMKKLGIDSLAVDKDAVEEKKKSLKLMKTMGKVVGIILLASLAKLLASMASFAFETGLSLGQMKDIGPALFINKKYVEAMAEEFGTINDVNAKTAWLLRKQQFLYGIQSDQAVKILRIQTAISDQTNDQLLTLQKDIALQARRAGVLPAKIFEDIANNMEYFAKTAKEGGLNVGLIAIAAKKLGLNLADVDQIATHLLDIEGSISAQFEASAILGKSINLDRARQLAILGKDKEMLKEIIKLVGTEAEFTSMNRVQREILAKAFGTDVQNLAKLVTTQKESSEAAEKVQHQYKNLAIIIGGIVGLIAGALIGGGITAPLGWSIMKGAAAGGIAGTALGYGIGMNLPEFQGLPPGQAAIIQSGAAMAHGGETIVNTADIDIGPLLAEIKELRKDINSGQGKIARGISELG